MSYSAEPSLGRRAGAGLFEPGNGLPATKEIHSTWLHAASAAVDENGAIIFINDELAHWLGQKPTDFIGKALGEVLARVHVLRDAWSQMLNNQGGAPLVEEPKPALAA